MELQFVLSMRCILQYADIKNNKNFFFLNERTYRDMKTEMYTNKIGMVS